MFSGHIRAVRMAVAAACILAGATATWGVLLRGDGGPATTTTARHVAAPAPAG